MYPLSFMVELADLLHNFLLLIGFILECLLIYGILTRTPHTMKNIQSYLFVITLSEILIIVSLAIFTVPKGVKGIPGVTLNGLLKYTGNYAGVITATGASILFAAPLLCILLCSLIRLLTVCGVEIEKYTPLFIFALIGSICGPAVIIPIAYPFFFLDKQKLILLATQRNLSDILDNLATDSRTYFVLDTSSRLIIPAGGLFILACGAGAAITIFINVATYSRSKRLMNTSNISASRHDLQRRLMFILLSQITAPILLGIIVFIICIPIIHDYFTSNAFDLVKITDILYCLAGVHTATSALITITVIRPYRMFVMNLFKRIPRQSSVNISGDIS